MYVRMYKAMRHVRVTIVAIENLLNITHSECVSVAVVTQHAISVCLIFVCGLLDLTVFFHTFS